MPEYVGRFAPTPSGALHLGSLVTALGSWLDARAAGGRWLLRIDDLDRPRVRPGAAEEILRQLEAHGLWWDGPIRRQSEHIEAYEAALARLRGAGLVYACRCTRAELARLPAPADAEGEPAYPGTCRDAGWPDEDAALRARVDEASRDPIGGDFVVRRRDGHIAYQLACAVDEHALGITDVVRGADLVQSGLRQAWLLRTLSLPVPRYRHLPLVLSATGVKLSKRTESGPLRADQASANLLLALRLLGQEPPADVHAAEIGTLLRHAIAHWLPERIPPDPVKMT